MKEPVTIVIPVLELPLPAVAMNSLATVHEHLGDFPITFIKGHGLTDVAELTEFCPTADFYSFDDRHFSSRKGYAQLLLSAEFYESFGWSRYLLICEMNTVITKNELSYWCRQGHAFIQPQPEFMTGAAGVLSLKRRVDPAGFLEDQQREVLEFSRLAGISLRNTEVFRKLARRKRRAIHRYLTSGLDAPNDAPFWEFYPNRWWPELNTPVALSRRRFAQSRIFAAKPAGNPELPFAISGLSAPLSAPPLP